MIENGKKLNEINSVVSDVSPRDKGNIKLYGVTRSGFASCRFNSTELFEAIA